LDESVQIVGKVDGRRNPPGSPPVLGDLDMTSPNPPGLHRTPANECPIFKLIGLILDGTEYARGEELVIRPGLTAVVRTNEEPAPGVGAGTGFVEEQDLASLVVLPQHWVPSGSLLVLGHFDRL